MSKPIKVINFNEVDVSKYEEGNLFYTSKSVGILIDGKIKLLNTSTPNLRNYVKKDEVEKMVVDIIKKVNKND